MYIQNIKQRKMYNINKYESEKHIHKCESSYMYLAPFKNVAQRMTYI